MIGTTNNIVVCEDFNNINDLLLFITSKLQHAPRVKLIYQNALVGEISSSFSIEFTAKPCILCKSILCQGGCFCD